MKWQQLLDLMMGMNQLVQSPSGVLSMHERLQPFMHAESLLVFTDQLCDVMIVYDVCVYRILQKGIFIVPTTNTGHDQFKTFIGDWL